MSSPRRYGSISVVESLSRHDDVQQVLRRLRSCEGAIELDGQHIDVAENLRLRVFMAKGVVCAACGLVATYFALEQVASDRFSGVALNLYADVDGHPILFTKDHTMPSSRGGADSLANLEPMCWPCNGAKGSQIR